MVRISTALIIIFLICTSVFVVLWIISPEKNWEPYATFVSAILIPLVFLFQKQFDSINNDQGNDEWINHDREVFNSLNELLDEDFVVRFVNVTGGSARCEFEDQGKLEYFLEEIGKSKYTFLNKKIEEKKSELIGWSTEVREFLRYNFDSLANPNLTYSKMCKPEDNPYGHQERYDHLNFDELYSMRNDLLWKMRDSYTEFRSEVKNNIYV
jgi:hypothetical protein